MPCLCSEGKTKRTLSFQNNDRKKRVFDAEATLTELHVHDCEYVSRRNSVLDEAEKIATEAAGGKRHGAGWHPAFFDAVNRLSIAKP